MQIPLFPLHTVLAPGIALPLHVFEDRYRLMVRRCLEASAPFGVVLIREGSEVAPVDGTARELAIAGVGTFAEIREASRYPDGRWDLLAVGTGRFVVREVRSDSEPYLVAEVDPYPDQPETGASAAADELAGRVTRRFVDYLRLLQPRDGETAEPIDVQMEVEADEGDEPAISTTCRSSRRTPDRFPWTMRRRPGRPCGSRTIRARCPTCCPGSSRWTPGAGRRCSRPPARMSGCVRSTSSWTASCGCWAHDWRRSRWIGRASPEARTRLPPRVPRARRAGLDGR